MALPNPIVEGNTLVIPAIQSADFTTDTSVGSGAATQGWQIARDGTATFANLNLFGNVGAASAAIDDLVIGNTLILPDGTDLAAYVTALSADLKGQCINYWNQSDAIVSGVSTELKVLGLDCFFQPDRIYGIHAWLRCGTSDTTTTGQALVRGLANTDGSFPVTPTVANTGVVMQMIIPLNETVNLYQQQIVNTTGWPVGGAWVRLIMTMARTAGAGTIGEAFGSGNPSSYWSQKYASASLAVFDSGSTANINQLGTGYNTTDTPPTSTPPPAPKTYTKVYYGTWSRTYDGDTTTTWDDTPYCYQGYYSSTRGNTRSLVGFDYAQIAADLSGATVNSCKLTVKGAHAYYNSGYTLWWGTHNYTAKPSTWADANVNQNRGFITGLAAGETNTINLGTSIGGEFKSQASRGISFGPGPSTSLTYYGYTYGATQSGKPYLTISYTK